MFRASSPIARPAEKKLRIRDAADSLPALRMLPSNHFEALVATDVGSMRTNRPWRICFAWHEDRAHDVEIYH